MNTKRIYLSIFWIILGVALVICSGIRLIDEFWFSMGVAFMFVGSLQVMRFNKYKKNEEYREKVDIENADERNKFIANKAWAWAGYIYIQIAGVLTIVFKIIDKEELMMAAASSVCCIMVAYWISYRVLQKKY